MCLDSDMSQAVFPESPIELADLGMQIAREHTAPVAPDGTLEPTTK